MQRSTSDPELPPPIDAFAPSKAYSPGQVGGAAFLGGPLAGAILLASNFELFGTGVGRGATILLGCLATIGALALAFVVPDSTPNALIPAAYTLAFQQISQRSHGDRFKEFLASGGERFSHWRVAGIGLLCLAGLFGILVAAILALPAEAIADAAV